MEVRQKRVLLLAGAVLVCLVIVIFAITMRSGRVQTAAASTPPSAAVAIAKRQPISNQLSIAGEFIPYQNVQIHAKVAGYIKKINVDIGDRVHTGQVLAVLEIPELVAQVDEANGRRPPRRRRDPAGAQRSLARGSRQRSLARQRRAPGEYRQGSPRSDRATGTGRRHCQRPRLAGAGRCRQVGAGRRAASNWRWRRPTTSTIPR